MLHHKTVQVSSLFVVLVSARVLGAEFGDLLNRVPPGANAIMLIDVEQLHHIVRGTVRCSGLFLLSWVARTSSCQRHRLPEHHQPPQRCAVNSIVLFW